MSIGGSGVTIGLLIAVLIYIQFVKISNNQKMTEEIA